MVLLVTAGLAARVEELYDLPVNESKLICIGVFIKWLT